MLRVGEIGESRIVNLGVPAECILFGSSVFDVIKAGVVQALVAAGEHL